MKTKIMLFICLALLAILQIHNIYIYPSNKGFDAGDHIEYITYLKTHHYTVPLANQGWELYQPPLYYFLATFLPNLKIVQYLGFIFWLGTAGIIYLFFLKQNKIDLKMALAATVITAATPALIYKTPAIGNELFSAMIMTAALGFYVYWIEHNTIKNTIILGILLGLSLLSKSTALLLLASIIIHQVFIHKTDLKNFLIQNSVYILLAAAIGGWFYIRNIIHFGSPFVVSADFPKYVIHQPPGYRDIAFFINILPFFTLDMYRAHYYSFLPGTYFSWFFDSHNTLLPVQAFSKAGALLIIAAAPILIASIIGLVKTVLKSDKKFLIFLIYTVILWAGYISFNLKLPYYSSVKGIYLLSAVLPYAFFIYKGIEGLKKYRSIIVAYTIIFVLLVIKNFWILSSWSIRS